MFNSTRPFAILCPFLIHIPFAIQSDIYVMGLTVMLPFSRPEKSNLFSNVKKSGSYMCHEKGIFLENNIFHVLYDR